jgi:NADP-dependent 3-hydroxy acid dehydrogenase YdfG
MKKNQTKKIKQKKSENCEKIFSLDIYNLNSIKNAIKDYKEIADIKIDILDNNAIINIKQKEDIPNIEYEFSNYVLGLMMNEE